MGAYSEELVKAGVMLAGQGLQPTSKGFRIRFEGAGRKTFVDGPFTEAKELIAGPGWGRPETATRPASGRAAARRSGRNGVLG